MRRDPGKSNPEIRDLWIRKFLAHLATDRGASVYTQRNYRDALNEFVRWRLAEQQVASAGADKTASAGQAVAWEKLQRDDFRSYLRFLGRNNLGRAATQLRFSALRTFYRFLIRHGAVGASPVKNLALPKPARRLPKYLTRRQILELLAAPAKLLETQKKRKGPGRPVSAAGLFARLGGAGNNLFLRTARERTVRPARRGH